MTSDGVIEGDKMALGQDIALGDVLSVFCPMYVRLTRSGHIVECGPTLQKMRPGDPLIGQRFLEVFELRRPRHIDSLAALRAEAGQKLHLQFREGKATSMIGVAVALPDGGVAVNLSPGISVIEAVGDYALTGTDFAPTDLTVEMLFLVEANTAAMEASRRLNLRLQGARIAAEEQAFTDTLTGLKNRRALQHILNRLSIAKTDFALVHLDLDFFKAVNDTYGHAAGDHVLQQAALRIVHEIRDTDAVARVGGDEFVLILNNVDDPGSLQKFGDRLIARLEEPVTFGAETCRISASIGVALSAQRPNGKMAALMEDADAALYAAKKAGRGCVRFAPDPEPGADVGRLPAELSPANDRQAPKLSGER